MKPFDYFNGMPIVITDAITKKVRCRTHRKKRVDKKWLKRYGYKELPDDSKILVVGNTLYMSKKNYDRLVMELAKTGGKI